MSPATIANVIAASEEAAVPAAPPTGMRPRTGSSAIHESGPITSRSRPMEMLRNARTTSGSNWVPAQRASSARASAGDIAVLYERTDVITS